jgi:hypothetical protein
MCIAAAFFFAKILYLATKKVWLQEVHVAIAGFFFFCRVVCYQNRRRAIGILAIGKANLHELCLDPRKPVN